MYVARLQREVRLGVSSRAWLRCSGSVGRDGRTMGRLGGTLRCLVLVWSPVCALRSLANRQRGVRDVDAPGISRRLPAAAQALESVRLQMSLHMLHRRAGSRSYGGYLSDCFYQDHRDPLTESARPICWQWITVAASGSSSGAPVPRTCSASPILSQTLQPVLAPGDRRLDLPHPAARNPRRLRVSDRNTAALSYGLYFKVVLTVGSPG